MNTRDAINSAFFAALAAAVLGRAGAARADVTAAWAGVTTYSYKITHVPDLDQRRFLVPNAGNMYCVPTSAVNWMAYFANHGVSSLAPGMGNWQSQTRYDDGTGAVIDMGLIMNTSDVNGTGGTDGLNGLSAWLLPRPFVVAHQAMDHTWTPRFQNMSEAVFYGAYVMPVVGWYNEFKFDPGGMERLGGHALSLTNGARSGSSMEIGWRDPARDEGSGDPLRLLKQSIFATEKYGLQPLSRKVWMDGAYRAYRTMDKVVGFDPAYLDAYYAIFPLFALSTQPESQGTLIAKSWAGQVGGSIQDNIIDFPYQEPLGSITLHPNLQWVLYTTDTELHKINPVEGTDEPVDYQLFTPGDIVVGRKRGVYLLDDTKLVCLNIDVNPPIEEASTFTSDTPGAMTYDDANDRVIILAPFDGRIMSYPANLSGAPEIITLPPGVTMDPDSRVAWDPATGGCWIVGPASDDAYHVQWDAGGNVDVCTLSDPGISAPVDVQVDDNGRVYIVAGDAVHEFDPVPARAADAAGGCTAGAWMPAADPYFPGLTVGGHLMLARSRTNFDPLIQVPAEWYNDLPLEGLGTSIPDCVSDISGDESVEVTDLLALLAAWGPCTGPCYEDLDADGDVSVTDLLQLLADWGPCPQ